jgi:hypothetical protein
MPRTELQAVADRTSEQIFLGDAAAAPEANAAPVAPEKSVKEAAGPAKASVKKLKKKAAPKSAKTPAKKVINKATKKTKANRGRRY